MASGVEEKVSLCMKLIFIYSKGSSLWTSVVEVVNFHCIY